MSGINDCLGIPLRGGSPPSRLIMSSSSTGPFASVATNMLTLTSTDLNFIKGEFEYVIDPINGDKVVIKKPGSYKLRASVTLSGANPFKAIVKNLNPSLAATNPVTVFDTAGNKPFFLAYGRTSTSFPGEVVATCRLEPYDIIQFFYTNTGAADVNETYVDVEYLGP